MNDVGYQSVAVPGTVAGLHEALHRFGTISWAEAIEPAIPLARHGFPVSGFMHGYWVTDYGPDVVPNAQRHEFTLFVLVSSVTAAQVITSSSGTSRATAAYAVTLTPEGSGWLVWDIEPADAGNS